MIREYFSTPVEELEQLFKDNLHNLQVLGEIRRELTFRTSDRAKQLLREVEAVESGILPVPPKPPRPDRPDDQQVLF